MEHDEVDDQECATESVQERILNNEIEDRLRFGPGQKRYRPASAKGYEGEEKTGKKLSSGAGSAGRGWMGDRNAHDRCRKVRQRSREFLPMYIE